MGEEAWQMIEEHLRTSLRSDQSDGAITDFDVTQRMIRVYLKRRRLSFQQTKSDGVPSAITAVERRAATEAARRAGAADARLIEQPLADRVRSTNQ